MKKNTEFFLPLIVILLVLPVPVSASPVVGTTSDGTISATLDPVAALTGGQVIVSGTAAGHPGSPMTIWIMGKDYADRIEVTTGPEGTFQGISSDPGSYHFGETYYAIFQFPGNDSQFDVYLNGNQVSNRKLGTSGTDIFPLKGSGRIIGRPAYLGVIRTLQESVVDDQFTDMSGLFKGYLYYMNIDPPGEHTAGDKITITGRTNAPPGRDFLIQVYPSSFQPTQKSQDDIALSMYSANLPVTTGDSSANQVSFVLDTKTFRKDEYLITIASVDYHLYASKTFNLLAGTTTTAATTTTTATATATITANTTTATTTTTTATTTATTAATTVTTQTTTKPATTVVRTTVTLGAPTEEQTAPVTTVRTVKTIKKTIAQLTPWDSATPVPESSLTGTLACAALCLCAVLTLRRRM